MRRRSITLVLALAALAPVGCKASGRVTVAGPAPGPSCGPAAPAPASGLRIETSRPPLAPALPPQ
jgi:hypothetical protein